MKLVLSFILIFSTLFAETPIFTLHSYHETYPWTLEQSTGFKSVLDNKKGMYPLYSTEHLDTKRRDYDKDYEEEFVHYLRSKYKNYQPALVYVTDDNALNFMIHHREKFFPTVPIVFSGINDISKLNTLDKKIFTGAFENKEIIPNIKLIKTLFPKENEILLLGDGSHSSLMMHDDIRNDISVESSLKIHHLYNQNFGLVVERLKEFKGKVLILTTIGKFKTKEGDLIPVHQVIDRIIKLRDFMVISLEDTYIQKGVIGGYANDGFSQGQHAGKMAFSILTSANLTLPKVIKKTNNWIFDAKALREYKIILPDEIAKQSKFLNMPKTFFQEHQETLVNLLYLLITIIILGILYFTFFMYRSRRIIIQREESLTNVTESLNIAQEIAHLGSWDWDIKNNNLWWSDEVYRIFGCEPQEFKSSYDAFINRVHPDDRKSVKEAVDHALNQNIDYHIMHRIVRKDGIERHVLEKGSTKMDDDGKPLRMIGIVHDITEQFLAREEIDKLSKVVEQIDDSVIVTDKEGIITYVNHAFYEHSGYEKGEVLGKTPRILKSDKHDNRFYQSLWKTILNGYVFRGTLINKKKNGDLFYEKKTIAPLRDEKNNIIGFVSSGKDVTKEVMMHREMEHIASFDKLTGIYNRYKFEEMLDLTIEQAHRFNMPLSLVLIDIDHFKSVNDTYGHDVGDEVLKQFVTVIQKEIRKVDIFARWGGEEFILLAPNTDIDSAQILAEKLRVSIEKFHFSEVKHITISLGISTLRETDTFKELFKRADQGLYSAKDSGRNQVGIA